MAADVDSPLDQIPLGLLVGKVRPSWKRAQAGGRAQLTCAKRSPRTAHPSEEGKQELPQGSRHEERSRSRVVWGTQVAEQP